MPGVNPSCETRLQAESKAQQGDCPWDFMQRREDAKMDEILIEELLQ
jgi:hypothetical protein